MEVGKMEKLENENCNMEIWKSEKKQISSNKFVIVIESRKLEYAKSET